MFVRTGAKKRGYLRVFFSKTTGNMSKRSNHDPGETENYPTSSSQISPGSILKSRMVFSTVPPSKTRIFVLKSQFLEPKNGFPYVIVGLKCRVWRSWGGVLFVPPSYTIPDTAVAKTYGMSYLARWDVMVHCSVCACAVCNAYGALFRPRFCRMSAFYLARLSVAGTGFQNSLKQSRA